MKTHIKVVLRKGKVYKNNTSPIFIRLTQDNQVKFISTGVAINPIYWDAENSTIKEDCLDRETLQSKINSSLASINKQIAKLEILDLDVTIEALIPSNSNRFNPTLEECFQSDIEKLRKAEKINTIIKYNFTLVSLRKFSNGDIRLSHINSEFLQEFESYLRSVGNCGNTIATKMATLKAVYNRHIKSKGVNFENPFLHYKVGCLVTPTRKRALTKAMILKFSTIELPLSHSPYLEFSKDIFLFSYYTAGINFRDIAMLKYNNISNGRLCYRRRKTNKIINCTLIKPALEIIGKYTQAEHSQQDYIFPILDSSIHLSEQQICNRIHKVLTKVNKHLKEDISPLLGLSQPITPYSARHTFATVLKRSGVNIALISEALGHSDISTTQIYLDSFENSQIDKALENLL